MTEQLFSHVYISKMIDQVLANTGWDELVASDGEAFLPLTILEGGHSALAWCEEITAGPDGLHASDRGPGRNTPIVHIRQAGNIDAASACSGRAVSS